MIKVKNIVILLLSTFLVCLFTNNALARIDPRVEDKRQSFAVEGIMFIMPCDPDDGQSCDNPYADGSDSSTPDNNNSDSPKTSPKAVGNPGNPFTPSGKGAALIASTAKAYSWPTDTGACKDSSGTYVGWKPNYAYGRNEDKPCHGTINDTLKAAGYRVFKDCGKFVGAVMRHTVDPSYPASGVRNQLNYLEGRGSSKWTKVSTDGVGFSMANLKPGDIITYSEGSHGHTMIWIGGQNVPCAKGSCYINVASSSFGTRSPSLNKITRMVGCSESGTGCPPYKVFRWTGD